MGMRLGESGTEGRERSWNEVSGRSWSRIVVSVKTQVYVTNCSPWSACSQMPPCLAGRGSIWAVACGNLDNWWPAGNTTVKIQLCSTLQSQNYSFKERVYFEFLLS